MSSVNHEVLFSSTPPAVFKPKSHQQRMHQIMLLVSIVAFTIALCGWLLVVTPAAWKSRFHMCGGDGGSGGEHRHPLQALMFCPSPPDSLRSTAIHPTHHESDAKTMNDDSRHNEGTGSSEIESDIASSKVLQRREVEGAAEAAAVAAKRRRSAKVSTDESEGSP